LHQLGIAVNVNGLLDWGKTMNMFLKWLEWGIKPDTLADEVILDILWHISGDDYQRVIYAWHEWR
jgi:hypothetical protein